MQKNYQTSDGEKDRLKSLIELEGLAEKKTKIYSKLLIDAALAQEMESLSERHCERRQTLEKLLYGKAQKTKKEQGRSEVNEE